MEGSGNDRMNALTNRKRQDNSLKVFKVKSMLSLNDDVYPVGEYIANPNTSPAQCLINLHSK